MKSSRWSIAILLALVALGALTSSAMAAEHYGLEESGKPAAGILRLENTGQFSLISSKYGTLPCEDKVVFAEAEIKRNEAGAGRNEAGAKSPYFKAGWSGGTVPGGSKKVCKTGGGNGFWVENMIIDNLESVSGIGPQGAEANLSMSFNVNLGSEVICQFSATKARVRFYPGTNQLELVGQQFAVLRGQSACGAAWTVNARFLVSQARNGQTVIVN